MSKPSIYVIAPADYPRWSRLGWRRCAEQPDNVLGLMIQHDGRYPKWPCRGCSAELGELRFTTHGRCMECVDEDEVFAVLH